MCMEMALKIILYKKTMAQLLPTAKTSKGKRKSLPTMLKIDMTPMVDLGFLLITFFIFTSTMAESKATDLVMPKEGEPSHLKQSNALTLLLHEDDKVYVYEGEWKNAYEKEKVRTVSFDNKADLRNMIQKKQNQLGQKRDELMVLIKPSGKSRYTNIVDALDEMLINHVKRYAVVDMSAEELAHINK